MRCRACRGQNRIAGLFCFSEGRLQKIEKKISERKVKLESQRTQTRRQTKLKDHRRYNDVKKSHRNEKIRYMTRRFTDRGAKAKKRGVIESGFGDKTTCDPLRHRARSPATLCSLGSPLFIS
jgi:hypothetical protein